jgi:hypothetical protein
MPGFTRNNFVLFCFFLAQMDKSILEKNQYLRLVNLSNCSYICSKFVLNYIKDGLDYFSISY